MAGGCRLETGTFQAAKGCEQADPVSWHDGSATKWKQFKAKVKTKPVNAPACY